MEVVFATGALIVLVEELKLKYENPLVLPNVTPELIVP
jgi:hypothetical protein